MNEIIKISNVNGYVKNGIAYLKLEDVARGLGITQLKNEKEYVRWDRVKEYLNEISFPTCGENDFIPENIFYKLCMKANNDTARKFQDLVCDEILPSIRKHGMYATEETIDKILNDPDFGIKLLTNLKEEKEKNKQLELENKVKDQQISELQPKASYYDLVLQCKGLASVSVIAKDFGLTARCLNTLLHEWKIQYKQGFIWLLYKEYGDKGYTQTKTNSIVRSDGTPDTTIYTYWTQKGRLFLYDLLKGNGYLPNIEKEVKNDN